MLQSRRMIGSVSFEPSGDIRFSGYPEGATVVHYTSPAAEELRRLYLFQADLNLASQWISASDQFDQHDMIREALALASLVRFCSCFESTSGHRRRPLRGKDIFSAGDRVTLHSLKTLRNKVVVHDDQLYPNHTPWAAIDAAGKAIEVGILAANVPFFGMIEYEQLKSLVLIAFAWVQSTFEEMATTAVIAINQLPPDAVLEAVRICGPLKIDFNEETRTP